MKTIRLGKMGLMAAEAVFGGDTEHPFSLHVEKPLKSTQETMA